MDGLLFLIPALPFLAFVLIVLFTNQDQKVSAGLTIGATAISWLLGWYFAFRAFFDPYGVAEEPIRLSIPWFPGGYSIFYTGFQVDVLTAVMLFMVPFLCFLIFVYSVGYMKGDPRFSRFFAYLALFATGMLGFILADNLLLAFIFWELMGVCSYLLIGFWSFRKPGETHIDEAQVKRARAASIKAFITTRVGDTIMLAGMVLLYAMTGSLRWSEILAPETLEKLADKIVSMPVFGVAPWATVLAILIFWGAIGKSAQFPLHVWLPDAMEGPTPVSALIHAATMVSAGVYLIIRTFPLFHVVAEGSNSAMWFVAFIGTFTALFAATIGIAQFDIKRVLAYSTISQLGYMFAALGIGAYIAAAFHLLMHAFFKALLFLGSGSVIHAMHHGHHVSHEHGHGHEELPIEFNPNDMRLMGGLLNKMPRTAWTFIAGGLSLSGFPLITAGFWSKDEILADAWHGGHMIVFWTLAIAAFVTAFYTGRQIFMVFFGQPRSEAAKHAHESPNSMTVPLVILAVFAIAAGWVGIPETFPGLGAVVRGWFQSLMGAQLEALHLEHETLPFNAAPLLISMTMAVGGLFVAWLIYGRKPLGYEDPLARPLGGLWQAWHNKYWVDELYQATVIAFAKWLAHFLYNFDDRWVIDPIVDGVGRYGRRFAGAVRRFIDEQIIDRIVNGTAWVSNVLGEFLRQIQTGQAQNYLLAILITVTVLIVLGVGI